MTQEGKQLLLKELCAMLPYKVKVYGNYRYTNGDGIVDDKKIKVLDLSALDWFVHGIDIKPYLRPMGSMTEEEKEYVKNRWCCEDWDDIYDFLNHYQIDAGDAFDFVDWLNAHHFDYRGLIEKGLALEAPEGMHND